MKFSFFLKLYSRNASIKAIKKILKFRQVRKNFLKKIKNCEIWDRMYFWRRYLRIRRKKYEISLLIALFKNLKTKIVNLNINKLNLNLQNFYSLFNKKVVKFVKIFIIFLYKFKGNKYVNIFIKLSKKIQLLYLRLFKYFLTRISREEISWVKKLKIVNVFRKQKNFLCQMLKEKIFLLIQKLRMQKNLLIQKLKK